MVKRKSRDRTISQKAIAVARQARVPPAGQSVQERLWVKENLQPILKAQSPKDRGQTWADGYLLQQQIGILHNALRKLSGFSASYVCDQDITLLVGQQSFTADTHLKAVLQAIAYYLPQEETFFEQSDFDLETRLTELDLLE